MTQLKYSQYDKDGKVICQLCGKSYQRIAAAHVATHNMTMEKYRKLHPDAPLFSIKFQAQTKIQNQSNKKDLFLKQQNATIEKVSDEDKEQFGASVDDLDNLQKEM